MTYEQVDTIAQGRVWTGSDALKISLVDEIGGLDAAIKEAAILGKNIQI
jgi:protease-4